MLTGQKSLLLQRILGWRDEELHQHSVYDRQDNAHRRIAHIGRRNRGLCAEYRATYRRRHRTDGNMALVRTSESVGNWWVLKLVAQANNRDMCSSTSRRNVTGSWN